MSLTVSFSHRFCLFLVGIGEGDSQSRRVSYKEGQEFAESIKANFFEVNLNEIHSVYNLFYGIVVETENLWQASKSPPESLCQSCTIL